MRLVALSLLALMVLGCRSGTEALTAPLPSGLTGRQWDLVDLYDRAVPARSDALTPNLVIEADSKRVPGSTGCNRLSGSAARTPSACSNQTRASGSADRAAARSPACRR